ncbi:unnamed protein product [Prorocentrum cordatum]|uniref:RlmI-like PUA domain-containing protein n=1 Tax=Prorocentrum cordatum TaxID=2364126 RepID=A0ABN9XGY0_9DINO|nr:unnamed protein product [Polarella glacialis]
MGHPWVYDDEVQNISQLGKHDPGTIVDLAAPDGAPLGVGVLNRQASIVVRRLGGLDSGAEVTQELLRQRLRAAFAERERRCAGGGDGVSAEYCRAVNGEQDGLPGMFVDRFGSAAVATFESVGSARLEFLVQEELTRWMGKLRFLAVHRMVAAKEKWAQQGQEFTTDVTRGDGSRVVVLDRSCSFEIDVHHGPAGHWCYGLEALRQELVGQLAMGGTVLDAWSHVGQWGVRCAKAGAQEVVLLDDSLSLAKVCQDNVVRNGVEAQSTVLHRGSVHDELRNMTASGIRFDCVALNVRVKFERYFKQRHGQFGRWTKPSLKGYATAISLGARITGRGGYLVVAFVLPLAGEHFAASLLQDGLERASRTGSIVFHASGVDENSALASSAMDDLWVPVLLCARLN